MMLLKNIFSLYLNLLCEVLRDIGELHNGTKRMSFKLYLENLSLGGPGTFIGFIFNPLKVLYSFLKVSYPITPITFPVGL